jgi:hypothetical protein
MSRPAKTGEEDIGAGVRAGTVSSFFIAGICSKTNQTGGSMLSYVDELGELRHVPLSPLAALSLETFVRRVVEVEG